MLKTYREANLTAKHQGFVYQVEAFEAVKDLPYSAVFHEQGLGKTKIGVDLVLYWLRNDIVDSVIIITKKGLIRNWRDELAAHTHLEAAAPQPGQAGEFLRLQQPRDDLPCALRGHEVREEAARTLPEDAQRRRRCWTRPTRSRTRTRRITKVSSRSAPASSDGSS